MYAMPPWDSIKGVTTKGELLSDPVDSLMPSIYLIKEAIKTGQIPLWNPYVGMGTPFYVSLLSLIMYPLNWLLILLPISTGVFLSSYIRLLICLYGMYLFLGRHKLNLYSKVIGAIVFAFSAPMIVWNSWPHTFVSCLAPLLFYYVDCALVDKNFKCTIISIVILTEMFYGGMPPYVGYFLYALGLYIVLRLISINKKDINKYKYSLLNFIFIVLFGAGLSFAYTGNLVGQINSLGYLKERADYYKMTIPINALKEFIFPRTANIGMNFNEYGMYIGIITVLLVLLGVVYIKESKEILICEIVNLLLVALIFTHKLDILAKYLPIINTSFKTRLMVVLMFSMAITAAFVFEKLYDEKNRSIVRFYSLIICTFMIVVSVIKLKKGFNIEFIIPLASGVLFLALVYFKNISSVHKGTLSACTIVVVVVDLLIFGASYNPVISGNAKDIPTTDSIKYLQSVEGNDRFVALGSWTLFPNTGMYYGLYDVRAHDFIVTEDRMNNFFTAIDPDCYKSLTRTEYDKITNYNIFDLTSAKYILTKNKIYHSYSNLDAATPKQPIGEIVNGEVVKQSFTAEYNNLTNVSILLATYEKKFDETTKVDIKLIENSTGKIIAESNIPAASIGDNQYYSFDFPKISDSKNKSYTLEITSNAKPGNAITAWSSDTDAYKGGSLSINDKPVAGDLFLIINAESDNKNLTLEKKFKDGMFLYVNKAAYPRTFISHKVEVEKNEGNILNELNLNKSYNNLILEEKPDIMPENNTNTKAEYSKLIKYGLNKVIIEANLNSNGFVTLTDNYYQGWKVKVDGKEQKIYRGDYLFRTVELSKGKHTIEFDYDPQKMYSSIYVSLGFFILLTGIILLKRKFDVRP
jgi:uncharacterized membrane protein YfhO